MLENYCAVHRSSSGFGVWGGKTWWRILSLGRCGLFRTDFRITGLGLRFMKTPKPESSVLCKNARDPNRLKQIVSIDVRAQASGPDDFVENALLDPAMGFGRF